MKIFTLLLLFLPCFLSAQETQISCDNLKQGIFHMYPINSTDHHLILREGDIAREVNAITGDSSFWEIKWTKDCVYSMKYSGGGTKMDEKTEAFLKKHKLVYEVTEITNDYYTFKGYVDKVAGNSFQSDTVWFNEKVNVVNNDLFKRILNPTGSKPSITDTSRYAILYVYRPGKITNSLGDFPVYFNDNIMCIAKNNTGYVFKVLKEGVFELKSRLYRDKSSINLSVKFGNVYYVKSMIHWGIHMGNNFKLEMKNVSVPEGESEVANVKIN